MTPPPDPAASVHSHTREQHSDVHESDHPDIGWFLRRELFSVPLAVAVVATLLLFGISPATLIFVALMTVLALGLIFDGR